MKETFVALQTAVQDFNQELSVYLEKGATNAAQAQRLRKQSLELTKMMKDFRANSVEHHRKG